MTSSILYTTDYRLLVVLLFGGIILFYFLGLSVLLRKVRRSPAFEPSGMGPFEGAMLGLISLLLAFTFSTAASYYNSRREELINETNAIGTAVFRADLYPDSIRRQFRQDFKKYVNARIRYYQAGTDPGEIAQSIDEANAISQRLWDRTATISKLDGSPTKSMQMIPAIGDIIDAVSSREEARVARIPGSILWLLFTLCMAGSFIVGYASKSKKADWVVPLSYSLVTVMTIYLIMDLDRPRYGIINTKTTHRNMYNLLESLEDVKTIPGK